MSVVDIKDWPIDMRERLAEQHCPFSHYYKGWEDEIIKLHNKLVKIDPDYRIAQVKEKFGGLRYYVDFKVDPDAPDYGEKFDKFYAAIRDCEHKVDNLCYRCGEKTTEKWHMVPYCEDCSARS